ncbi:hypothetical protein GCM10008018_45290 [Paenibacillus marchantiophytorum]|uniref:Protein kinase domain-containing protein n=1 Tax=Paenibacillus marchantiophytorum TaxID=1619310 RepID=A0ABQ1EZL4_9BACL|nr:serine/threonine-protein kinase [Paenibacillus marchantiophytorum]GFZ93798.1 hypothetical protein GCM10008018_45290 [Paenibacillus marchantiophytorum]
MVKKRYLIDLRENMLIGDRYILKKYISEGTYGYVWKAIRCSDGETVALKIPKNQERGDACLIEGEQFMDLQHINIIQIYWMGRVDGYFVIEMEYFPGEPLSRELTESGLSVPRTFKTVYEIFEHVLNGLECMHSKKIAHGDLKPDNILINATDVKITDFGTSKLIEDYFVKTIDGAGTYAYIAPEVINSQKRYLNSDIYSLGAILYQFLTGKTPHETFIQVINNFPYAKPRELNENITEEMERVILIALNRDPLKRYQNVHEFRSAFKDAVNEQFKQVSETKYVPRATLADKKDALELAISNCKLGKFKLAEKILLTKVSNGHKLPEIVLQLAYIYFKTDRRFDAIRILDEINITEIESVRQEGFTEAHHYLKARIVFEIKQYEQALKLLKWLCEKNPKSLDYRYRLAMCYGLCNLEDQAISILEEINRDTPGIWAVVKKLGQAYEQKKDYERARGYFKYALRLRPNDELLTNKLEKYDFYL